MAGGTVRAGGVTTRSEASRSESALVVGAALGGLAWGMTGFVALIDPGPDPGPPGTLSFYLIEGGHALGEASMGVALIGLLRSQRAQLGRVGNLLSILAIAATFMIAAVTCIVVVGTALGFGPTTPDAEQSVPAPLIVVASTMFLLTLIGILAGYIGSGLTTIRAGVWPPLVGWLLIAFPFLLAALFVLNAVGIGYKVGIAIGVEWLAVAWVARKAFRSPT